MQQIENGALFTMRDKPLRWRNFEGRATMFKEPGPDNRTFNVVLDDELALSFLQGGLNIRTKCWSPRQAEEYAKAGYNVSAKIGETADGEEDPARHTLQIAVGYKIRPPRVVMITSKTRVNLGEDTVGALDWVDIEKVDFIFRAGHWSAAGKQGIKCWLKTMFVTINEDELEAEYGINDVETASVESVREFGPGDKEDEEPF